MWLIYILALFSFFHFLIGYGILGSIFASILLVVLSPFIFAAIAAISLFFWGLVILVAGWVCATIAGLVK